ncbi:transient receptor potential cation channel subfamily M member-like 2 [Mytilus galloprovincialis]|uniref:transient receptor potential cation channel subfamily M member-like 2 n=1 Tax=Mytilus galloprovincialis TaxID=29158 RepID=UPI003F7BBEC4
MTETNNVDSIWRQCSEDGKTKPWFVISVIGDTTSIVPSTWEKSGFQSSLIDTAKGAKECWIFHKGGKGKLSETVRKAVKNYRVMTGQRIPDDRSNRIKHFDIWKNVNRANIKLIAIQSTEKRQSLDSSIQSDKFDKHFEIADDKFADVHTNLLKKIGHERVKIMKLQKDLTIRIPVIVIVAEGDIKTIRHVDQILQQGIPVVIIKGSGKAADVISEYLIYGEDVLKSTAPLLLGTYTHQDDLMNIELLMKSIQRQGHMISIFDIKDPTQRSLSDTTTDAILRAWSIGTTNNSLPNTPSPINIDAMKQTGNRSRIQNEKYPIPNLKEIANFEEIEPDSSTEKLKKKSNFLAPMTNNRDTGSPVPLAEELATPAFSRSKTLNPIGVKTWLNPSSFPLYFFIAYQLIQLKFKEDEKLCRENLTYLLEKAIEADKLDYVTVLLQEHDVKFDTRCFPHLYAETVKCKLCEHDCQHLYSVIKMKSGSRILFDEDDDDNGHLCIDSARSICATFLHYPRVHGEYKEAIFHDLLIWSLFAHRPKLATMFWKACDDQLLTSLLATGILKKMASSAKENADQSVFEDLMEHARVFERRSLEMQSTVYKDHPKEAMELMTTEVSVWDIHISPLQCAYDNDLYDFIAQPCAQRCLNTIWYNKLGTNFWASAKKGFRFRKIGGKLAICRFLAAPFTKFVINYMIFLAALVIYSAFLLTSVKSYEEITWYEGFVYVWMFADIIEEYVVPKVMGRDANTDNWYRFRRYIGDFWNVLDTISYITTFIAIGLRFIDLKWARRIYSFSLFMVYMRFLHFVLIYRKVGVYVILIKEMMRDLARYFVILIVFMVAVGVMYHANRYPNHNDMWSSHGVEYWRIWRILNLPYWQLYGEILLDELRGENETESCSKDLSDYKDSHAIEECVESDWIILVIAAFYMLLSNLLLVNLVIALFSARFEKVKSNSEKIWRYIRYSYIMDYKIRLPAGLNLVLRPIMAFLWICGKCKHNKVDDESLKYRQEVKRASLEHIRTLQSMCVERCI